MKDAVHTTPMNSKKTIGYSKALHKTFKVSIFFKGFDGVLEIIGGILLFVARPSAINRLLLLLTAHELSEDPKDIIASFCCGKEIDKKRKPEPL